MSPPVACEHSYQASLTPPPYEGMPVTGRPESVVVCGRPVVAADLLTAPEPHGRHLRSGPLSGL
ncbi:hypothetical protein ACFPH6_51210 [Streptomyces xiangluensis]|uniref:Uncharacterized protein n=1 Tax=Streptomyces xiangluensis TaxID=2665720 RepID=A0ABV8Z8B8_9ACTN